MDVDQVADELYTLAPGQFTSARDARVAEARKAGDRPLAGALKRLRKPTAGAWLANVLARERPDEVDRLLELGVALRRAQSELAGDELRRLSQDRHGVVAALSQEARALADAAGLPATGPAVVELEETLDAALSDPAAAEVLRAGRLTSGLRYAGMGFGMFGAASPAAGRRTAAGPPAPRGNGEAATARRGAGTGAAKRRAGHQSPAAQQVDLRRAVTEAASEAKRATRDAETARRTAQRAERDLEAVRKELAGARATVEELKTQEADIARRARDSAKAREVAERAERTAGEGLRRLRGG